MARGAHAAGAERGAGPRPAALGAGDAGSGAAMERLLPPSYRAQQSARQLFSTGSAIKY